MEITLEKIELVKDRTGVSYKEAKDALEAADGNVVDAIIGIEEAINRSGAAKVIGKSTDILDAVKDQVRKGNVTKLVISKDEDVLLNMPVNATIVGALVAPWAALLGTAFCFGLKYTIELVLDDGSKIDITEKATDKFGDVVEKGGRVVDAVKDKGAEVAGTVSDKVQGVVNKTKQTAQQLNPEDFKDTVDELWSAAKQRVESASEAAGDVKDKAAEVVDAVKDVAGELAGKKGQTE
jgi:methyl-accepting chemotaxis protein